MKMNEKENNNMRIVKVKKNSDGDITDIMLNDGAVYSIDDAISMAKHGTILGVNVGQARNGREYLRSNPNGQENDNLDNLPTF
ncbi:DUF3892 domain-containing protein [Clostridium omnivorum]|nr:DUF3892 domain-containing protein [Clostridium sp. E14]